MGMTLRKLEAHSWIILCRMKDACRGKINICSTSYVTQTLKNPNTYTYQTLLKCCYCVFSFPCLITLQDKGHISVRKPTWTIYFASGWSTFSFSTFLCSRWKYDLKLVILFRIDFESSEYFSPSSWRTLLLSSRFL